MKSSTNWTVLWKMIAYSDYSRPKHSDLYTHARVNCLKTIPFTVAHTYMAHIWQYPPRALSPSKDFGHLLILIQFEINSWTKTFGSFHLTVASTLNLVNSSIMRRHQTYVSNSCKSTATVWLKSAVASRSPTAGFESVLHDAQVSQLNHLPQLFK